MEIPTRNTAFHIHRYFRSNCFGKAIFSFINAICYYSHNLVFHGSLRARDGFIQPIFTKGLTASVCKSDKMD